MIAISLIGYPCSQKVDTLMVVNAQVRGCYNLPQNEKPIYGNSDSLLFFIVDVKVINTSNQPVSFFTYSCSIGENLILDNKLISLCASRCSGNGPIKLELKSKQTLSIPIILQVPRKISLLKAKIGWIYIDKTVENITFSDYYKLIQNKKKILQDVIWSNIFNLDFSGGKPYDIN